MFVSACIHVYTTVLVYGEVAGNKIGNPVCVRLIPSVMLWDRQVNIIIEPVNDLLKQMVRFRGHYRFYIRTMRFSGGLMVPDMHQVGMIS